MEVPAVEATYKYEVTDIKMSEIFADPDFNCRGYIAPIDVIDLAKDIKERGLDQPITIQPYTIAGKPEIKFRVVAGHRRHTAFRVNAADTIPAYIRSDFDETQARMYNLRENLHRLNLNILQEANALKYFLEPKTSTGRHIFTGEELAKIFGQSQGWVNVRRDLLKLPEDIQKEAAAGMINQEQIKQIARVKKKEDQYELVKRIKERKMRGETVKLSQSVQSSKDVMKAKERKKGEIVEINALIYDITGPNFATRALAWASGEISTAQLFNTVKEYCEEEGLEFKMPDFVNKAMLGIKDNEIRLVGV